MKTKTILAGVLLSFITQVNPCCGQRSEEKELTESEAAAAQGHGGPYAKTDPRFCIRDPLVLRKLEGWQDLKFGFFVHWGLYSRWGCIASWPLSQAREWKRSTLPVWSEVGQDMDAFRERYWDLNKEFNPVKFDPRQWVELAETAGMKYFVFTTKHHDGFAMFDTQLSDYKITGASCPFGSNPKANVTKELFSAFREKGFMIGAYISKPDWHHDDFWTKDRPAPDRHTNYDVVEEPERWERFVQFTQGQINELMSDYGRIDILWLDGGWVQPRTRNQDIRMDEIAANSRKKQPGLIVVDRTVHGEFENYVTPEQRIPEKALDYPWETCMTMGDGWGYNVNRKYKPTRQIVHMLIDVVSKGGNFLLNLGGSPEGYFHPTGVKQMGEIGEWMKVNGSAIYATRPISPYKSGNICFTMSKDGKRINAILLAEDGERMPGTLTIEGVNVDGVEKVALLGFENTLHFEKTGPSNLTVTIPEQARSNPPCAFAWTFVMRR